MTLLIGPPKNGVCAVIVTYHPEPAVLEQLLDAVLPQVEGVVVVDNGSDLDLAELLTGRPLTVLQLGENLGVAAGFNRGIDWAGKHHFAQILLLDQDSVPAPDMVARLQLAVTDLTLRGEPVAAVGPVTRHPQSGTDDGFARLGRFRFRFAKPMAGEELVPADFLISSGSLLPMTALRSVGLMDEGLFIDLVDTEWFLRSRALGLRAFGVGSALLHHGIGEGTAGLQLGTLRLGALALHGPLRHYYIFRNSLLLSRRSYVPWRWIVNNAVQLLGMFVYFSLAVPQRRQQLRMMLRGVWDGLRGRTGVYR
jgi:rhamnosyltransferase